jgi:two-component system NarL family response regulator
MVLLRTAQRYTCESVDSEVHADRVADNTTNKRMVIRVGIVEDQGIVREMLGALLAREPDMKIIGEASSGGAGLDLAAQRQPDVLVLDVSLPDIDGVEVARAVRRRHPAIGIVALSIHDEPHFVEAMLRAGALGYVVKSATIGELREAIRAVARGLPYLSAALRAAAKGGPSVGGLGRREREVLALLAEGRRSTEIARRLGISPATVDVHRRNIMRKLDLHTVAELTKFAVRHGLTSL